MDRDRTRPAGQGRSAPRQEPPPEVARCRSGEPKGVHDDVGDRHLPEDRVRTAVTTTSRTDGSAASTRSTSTG